MFRPYISPIFRESHAAMFQLELSHVVVAVVLTTIKIIKIGL